MFPLVGLIATTAAQAAEPIRIGITTILSGPTADGGQSEQYGAKVNTFPSSWLVKKLSITEAEAAHPGIRDDRVLRFPNAAKAFGFNNDKWESLKAAMKPGDELWEFCSSTESWQNLAGRRGIVLLRDGVAIAEIVTLMN